MRGDGGAAHEAAEEPEGPPGGLANDAALGGHERADDVDGLGNVGHANVAALPHEHVEPDGDGERIRQRVLLLGPLIAGCALRVPDVPFVKADLDGRLGRGHVGLDAGEVDEGGGDLNGALGGEGCGSILAVLLGGGIDVDAVHVGSPGGDALVQDVVIPGALTVLTTEDEAEGRV